MTWPRRPVAAQPRRRRPPRKNDATASDGRQRHSVARRREEIVVAAAAQDDSTGCRSASSGSPEPPPRGRQQLLREFRHPPLTTVGQNLKHGVLPVIPIAKDREAAIKGPRVATEERRDGRLIWPKASRRISAAARALASASFPQHRRRRLRSAIAYGHKASRIAFVLSTARSLADANGRLSESLKKSRWGESLVSCTGELGPQRPGAAPR